MHDPRLPPAAPPRGFALWALGFRPFYLLAAAFASVSIPLWIAQYAGVLPAAYLRSPTLHGHEMLFGYTMAVIAGFLFTAGRNWTAQPTPTGGLLVAYALLWIAGRVLVLTPWTTAAGVANAAFPLAVAAGLAVPLARSGNRRNYFFVALLALMGAADLVLLLTLQGVLEWPARLGLQAGMDVVLFVMAVMGGRVIPMFTNNGVPGA
ncbi:MAG: NnrS family protein, partial [Burkholderiales bacterium]|nr:NnrS family protein [Burkholderiales bacterium]